MDQRWGPDNPFQDASHLSFEFISHSDYPRDVYLRLGVMFPELSFDIAAIDGSYTVQSEVLGDDAYFHEDADPEEGHERVYKQPMSDLEE